MRRIALVAICSVLGLIKCLGVSDFYFNFTDPTTLTPSITPPEKKESVPLDGVTFTNGCVEVTFTASVNGNTHVRLYRPYDIEGCDVRLYDGETMTVRVTDADLTLDRIKFDMSLSGAASGSNDVWFVPSEGEFVWEDEMWYASPAQSTSIVYLVSAEQSRLAGMTVYVREPDGVSRVNCDSETGDVEYYTLMGVKIAPEAIVHGVYVRVAPGGNSLVNF